MINIENRKINHLFFKNIKKIDFFFKNKVKIFFTKSHNFQIKNIVSDFHVKALLLMFFWLF